MGILPSGNVIMWYKMYVVLAVVVCSYSFAVSETLLAGKRTVTTDSSNPKSSLKSRSYLTRMKKRDVKKEQQDDSTWSPWLPTLLCIDGQVNFTNMGCGDDETFFEQTRTCMTQHCEGASQRTIPCNICLPVWSAWSPCCDNKSCPHDVVGEVRFRQKLRYGNISQSCVDNFEFDSSCHFEVETKNCISGRAVPIGPAPGGEEQSETDVISNTAKIIAFALVGTLMVVLLAFTGKRLGRTIMQRPGGLRRTTQQSLCEGDHDSQYSNLGYQGQQVPQSPPGNSNGIDACRIVVLNPSIRRLPGRGLATTPLSIIKEEDDVISASEDDIGEVTENSLSRSHQSKLSSHGSNEAIQFMDEVLTQLEQENDDEEEDEDQHETSVARPNKDNLNFLNNLGWNPGERDCRLQPLETDTDTQKDPGLTASVMSLASASLLRQGAVSVDSSYRTSLSSMTSDEDSYSLNDMSECFSESAASRQYSSLPDVAKLRDFIPDIDEVLKRSDSQLSDKSEVI
ncbi:uncharacterized protein LOC143459059 [Clavelina lepadiformis]|uniref:uncharacterized protein LOC143459059 n=1 Tax=Clavelina lepadiformis TaxID=159417 RepID=UPI0040428D36